MLEAHTSLSAKLGPKVKSDYNSHFQPYKALLADAVVASGGTDCGWMRLSMRPRL